MKIGVDGMLRAPRGGCRGANGEWYEGGEFLPSSARTIKGIHPKCKFKSTGKREISPYVWAMIPAEAVARTEKSLPENQYILDVDGLYKILLAWNNVDLFGIVKQEKDPESRMTRYGIDEDAAAELLEKHPELAEAIDHDRDICEIMEEGHYFRAAVWERHEDGSEEFKGHLIL